MQTQLQHVHVRQPQTFRYSLDWRFLLPMGDEKDIYVLFEQAADFSQTLAQVGVSTSNQLSFTEFRKNKNSNIPLLVIPFGLPIGEVGADNKAQTDFYSVCRRSMASDGHLLIGFNNTWYFRNSTTLKYFSSTPHRITYQLKQAGFRSIRIFGAMPNLNIPEYIFDLESQAIYFALKYRFRRKPVLLSTLHMLAETIGIARISNFLPCYFVVATV